jgi:hypothetical protein
MSCIGDFVDVVDSCTESVSEQECINRVMEESFRISNGYVPGEFASNRWMFPERRTIVMNENIISLFDQLWLLCYVVVFGNVSTMMERIPQTEREVFFTGVRKLAKKVRRNGEYAKRWIEWCNEESTARAKMKSTAGCATLFPHEEVRINSLQQSCFDSFSSP